MRISSPGIRSAFLGFLVLIAVPSSAWAVQRGVVLTDQAEVHQFPNRTSPEITKVQVNAEVFLSNELVQDVNGEYWYKVRTPQSETGYIRAQDVRALKVQRELREAGIDPGKSVEPIRSSAWTVLARLMGFGGYGLTPNQVDYGGEFELSFCPLLNQRGYYHRILGIGGVVQYLPNDLFVGGSATLRIYTERLWEPEFRFRFGQGLTSQSLMGGVNAGIQFPFSISTDRYFAGYVEAGGLVGVIPVIAAPIHLWGGAGIGFHF